MRNKTRVGRSNDFNELEASTHAFVYGNIRGVPAYVQKPGNVLYRLTRLIQQTLHAPVE